MKIASNRLCCICWRTVGICIIALLLVKMHATAQAQADLGSIGDTVWLDLDGDGIEDDNNIGPRESGIPGVIITLTDSNGQTTLTATDDDGQYLFENLSPDSYTVLVDAMTLLPDLIQTYDADGALDHMSNVTVTAGLNGDGLHHRDQDFGYQPLGSVGDLVWLDLNNDGFLSSGDAGLPYIALYMYHSDGITYTTTTDLNGNYLFEGLPYGNYTLQIDRSTLPPDVVQMDYDNNNSNSSNHTLNGIIDLRRPHSRNQDFGYQLVGSIGNRIWMDLNDDGIQNLGEAGISDVVLTLTDSHDNIFTTNTDEEGQYLFQNLPLDTYQLAVESNSLSAGLVQTFDSDDILDHTSTITLTSRHLHDRDQDFGYRLGLGAIGDRVWADYNSDGHQDLSEIGLAGVTLILTDSSDQIMTTTTDANGNYLFIDVPLGEYTITVDSESLPTHTPTCLPARLLACSPANVTLEVNNSQNLDQDFGYKPLPVGHIGDRVWLDLDGDGRQDANENGISDVIITLTDSSGNIYTTTTKIDPDVQNGDGHYRFDNLLYDRYTIAVDPASLPPDLVLTFDDNGALDQTSAITIDDQNPDDRAQDFGYRPTGSAGGTIWRDHNDDGIQEVEENGLSDITVKLTSLSSPQTQLTTTTDHNGIYHFDDLPYDAYTLEVDTANFPPFLAQTHDDDGLLDHLSTLLVNINQPHHLDQHFGYRPNVQPEIGLEKLTRSPGHISQDADDPPGPMILINSPVIWHYEVTNLGNVDLADIELNDDIEGQVTRLISGDLDNDTILDVGEIWIYNLTGLADAGQYDNTATVSGQPVDSDANPLLDADQPFTRSVASDDSHYFGADPSISIESVINDMETATAPGPPLLIGSALTWSYSVINTGNVPLDNIKISNDHGLAIDCAQTRLDSSETMTCIALGAVAMGHVEILSQVQGTPVDSRDNPIGPSTYDQALNYYNGSFSAIQLEKSINGIDGDEVPGPLMQVGDPAVWHYTVRNLGNTPLTDVNISDEPGVILNAEESAPGVNIGDLNQNNFLDVSEVWRYRADHVIKVGLQNNLATVLATPIDENGALLPGSAVRDEDNSHYTGYLVDPELDMGLSLEAAANNVADDLTPGLYVAAGAPVAWTYELQNTATLALRDVRLSDSLGSTVLQEEIAAGINIGDDNQNGLLEQGEVWLYFSKPAIAQVGQHGNIATVQAMPIDTEGTALSAAPIEVSNPSHYFGAESAIELTYIAGGALDNTAHAIDSGDLVLYTLIVRNSGNVLLAGLEITDDNGTPDDSSDDLRFTEGNCPGLAAPLPPAQQGGIVQCTFTKNITQDITHVASVRGAPVDANGDLILDLPIAIDSDNASVQIAQPAIQLETTIYRGLDNGRGCEKNEGQESAYTVVGEPVTYCFQIINVGNVPLTHIQVTDDILSMSVGITETLAPGASILLTLDRTAQSDLVNSTTVRGLPTTAIGWPTGAPAVVDTDGAEVVIDIVSIGNRVWHDLDGDGQQNRTEPGIAEVVAVLINGDTGDGVLDYTGRPITMVTDLNGYYLFENLPPDNYAVEFDLATLPRDYALTLFGEGNDSIDSDVNPENGRTTTTGILFGGDEYMGLDMGLVRPVSIGSRVWYDNDGNGVAGNLDDEPGVAGVRVTLHDGETEQPILDVQGQPMTATTDSDGNYLFTDLFPGEYGVTFDLDTVPSSYRPNEASKNGILTTGFLNSGEQDMTLNMGIIASTAIGDRVWFDHDGDGLQGPDEPGMAGLTLLLLDGNSGRPYLDVDGIPMATVTDSDGGYRFENLPPGNYSVQLVLETLPPSYGLVAQNQGRGEQLDSDADPMTGKSSATGFLHSGEDVDHLDIGLVLASEIQVGDRIWFDENGNGLQDHLALEPGISGITINLFNADGTPALDQLGDPVPSQVSDEEGHYLFTDLLPGDYYVKFDLTTISERHRVTAINQSSLIDDVQDALDSDVDPRTGRTATTGVLAYGKQNRTLDMGLTQPRFDLALDKKLGSGQPAIIRAGDDIRFTLTLHNQGDITASQITLVDYLPFGFQLSESEDQGWTMEDGLATMTLSNLALDPGQSTTVDIVLTAGNRVDGPVTNYAEIASAQDADGVIREDSDGTFDRENSEPAERLVRDGVLDSNFTDLENPDEDNHDIVAFAVEELASIGNQVWLDLDEDNVQDENELGVPNVIVNLYDAADTLIRTTITDEDGNYLFTDLQPGDYYVIFTPADGFEIINQGLDIAGEPSGLRSPFISLESGEHAEGGAATLLPNEPTDLPSVNEPNKHQIVFLPIVRL